MMILRTSIIICLVGMIYSQHPIKMIDLTHTFNNDTLYWPDEEKFEVRITERGTRRGFWLQLEEYSSTVHAGTHMDAPCEYAEGHWCIDQIPMSRFFAPAAVIDITEQAAANRDYTATIQDLQNWERENSHTLDGMIVLLKSGWGKRWGDKEAFTGTVGSDASQLHFPGMSPEAAQWIVENRSSVGVGTETLNVDAGPDTQFLARRILSAANIYALDCVANMDQLPAMGATVYVYPMKIGGAGGAPARIVASLPKTRLS